MLARSTHCRTAPHIDSFQVTSYSLRTLLYLVWGTLAADVCLIYCQVSELLHPARPERHYLSPLTLIK